MIQKKIIESAFNNLFIYYLFLGIETVISINSSFSCSLYSAGILNLFNTCFIVLTYSFPDKTPLPFLFFICSPASFNNSELISSSVFFTFKEFFITLSTTFNCNSSLGKLNKALACLSVRLFSKQIILPLNLILIILIY